MANPPLYHFNDDFFAIPFPPFGYLCFLKENYRILFNKVERSFSIKETEQVISGNKISIDKLFIYDDISFSDLLTEFSHILLVLWLKNYGFKKSEIYFIGNSKTIDLFMSDK